MSAPFESNVAVHAGNVADCVQVDFAAHTGAFGAAQITFNGSHAVGADAFESVCRRAQDFSHLLAAVGQAG